MSTSRQRGANVVQALADLPYRGAGAGVLVFNVGGEPITLVLEELQHWLDRRVAVAEGLVGTVVALAILQVQVGDLLVVRADEADRVETCGAEVSDIEINSIQRRH